MYVTVLSSYYKSHQLPRPFLFKNHVSKASTETLLSLHHLPMRSLSQSPVPCFAVLLAHSATRLALFCAFTESQPSIDQLTHPTNSVRAQDSLQASHATSRKASKTEKSPHAGVRDLVNAQTTPHLVGFGAFACRPVRATGPIEGASQSSAPPCGIFDPLLSFPLWLSCWVSRLEQVLGSSGLQHAQRSTIATTAYKQARLLRLIRYEGEIDEQPLPALRSLRRSFFLLLPSLSW
jgi:hypothetical protein